MKPIRLRCTLAVMLAEEREERREGIALLVSLFQSSGIVRVGLCAVWGCVCVLCNEDAVCVIKVERGTSVLL